MTVTEPRGFFMRYAIVFVLLGGCLSAPDLGEDMPDGLAAQPYPRLVPLDQLLIDEAPEITPDLTASLSARLNALRLRAARLRAMQP